MKTSNPALTRDPFSRVQGDESGGVMSIEGCIQKSGLLVILVIFSAFLTWGYYFGGAGHIDLKIIWISMISGLVCSLVIIFKPRTAPYLSPVYALIEGVFLGAITLLMELAYPGIAIQAVIGTFGVFGLMLVCYKMGWIKVTEKFRSILTMAVGGVALIYLVSFVGSFIGFPVPFIHESGIIGIGFSVFVCGLAALSLLLDFDLIERGTQQQAPKFMEWYAAFALLVTLIWLYLEILKLLAKARRR